MIHALATHRYLACGKFQGRWISTTDKAEAVTCPECLAAIHKAERPVHYPRHAVLEKAAPVGTCGAMGGIIVTKDPTLITCPRCNELMASLW